MALNRTWEDLRVDTTFHGAGAEPSPLVRDLWERARQIPGWFTVDDMGHFALVLGMQAALGVRGDLLEIGTYYGRSAAVLAQFLGAGETLLLCDTFRTKAVHYPDPPAPEQLWEHLRRVHPALDEGRVVVHAGPSETFDLSARRLRFAHIDGDHTEAGALDDFRRAAERLTPGGILVVDDYHHGGHPGVTAAADRFLAERTDFTIVADLNRHGERGRKLYLAKAGV